MVRVGRWAHPGPRILDAPVVLAWLSASGRGPNAPVIGSEKDEFGKEEKYGSR